MLTVLYAWMEIIKVISIRYLMGTASMGVITKINTSASIIDWLKWNNGIGRPRSFNVAAIIKNGIESNVIKTKYNYSS